MSEDDKVSENNGSEWYVILAITGRGQHQIGIAQDMDGPVLATASSKEEAIEQAMQAACLFGYELYDSEMDV